MAAVLMLQGAGGAVSAAETQAVTEAQAQTETQPATEAQTQPQTETQPATEAQTQPQTETQPATEAQTQPQTETQPATEAQPQTETQPATEAQPQSSETQPQTGAQEQTAASSGQTEAQTADEKADKKKKNKKKEETERSERKNDGAKMSSSDLASGLGNALSYLFAARTVSGPETLLEGQEIADGETGTSIVGSLESFSVKLANARSSSDVEIINVYADENGKLDEKQLEDQFENRVIDVSKKYYVINVIADSPDQALQFAGYDMILSGSPVVYDDASQTGDILYNFAALDGEDFVSYKGTLTLAGQSGLQGTYLAPGADVQIQSDLAGAVYAGSVNVADQVASLLNIAFLVQKNAGEETEGEQTEALTEEEPQSETEALTEEEAQSETEALTEEEPQSETEALTEEEIQSGTEALTEEEPQSETEALTEDNTMEITDSVDEVLDMAAYLSGDAAVYYSADTVQISLKLEFDPAPGAASGKIAVRAAADILNPDNTVRIPKDTLIVPATDAASGPAEMNLQSGAVYYLELSELPDGYMTVPRIYLMADAAGGVTFSPDDTVTFSGNTGTIRLSEDSSSQDGTAVLSAARGDETGSTTSDAVTDAAFVVKDSTGAVVKDASGNPYYIRYTGSPVVLTGLAAGTYTLSQLWTDAGYVIAEDTDFEIKADQSISLQVTNKPVAAGSKSFTAAAQAQFNGVALTADEGIRQEYYLAVFADSDGDQTIDQTIDQRVSGIAAAAFTPGQQRSSQITFSGYDQMSSQSSQPTDYYVVATDEFGQALTKTDGSLQFDAVFIPDTAAASPLIYTYDYGSADGDYPTGSFYYMAPVQLTKRVQNGDGSDRASTETFYAKLYSDAGLTQPIADFTFEMNGNSAVTATAQVKMTSPRAVFYPAETNQDGSVTDASAADFPYIITCPASIEIVCGTDPANSGSAAQAATEAEIVNRVNADASVVSVRITDENGNLFANKSVQWVIKGTDGKIISVNNKNVFQKSEMLLKGLTPGQTYLLSEVSAPSGYAPAADVEFTVAEGVMTSVALSHERTKATNHSISAEKQVYVGAHQVYAQDASDGRYAKQGKYTFYAALFSDSALTKKASNVQTITVKGFSGTTVFENLKGNTTYYIAETNQYGEPLASTSSCEIQYSGGQAVKTASGTQSATIRNVYSRLQSGYRYTALLTLTKRVTDASGAAVNVNGTFYAGIFRKADYSDKPTIVRFDLKNASSASARRRILLSGNSNVTYYIAEVDAQGNRLTGSSDFAYEISVDNPQINLARSDSKTVTITNAQKASEDSKVTLYLTKRVYYGAEQITVNDTFYAGLFKDENFTQLYTKPIPLALENKSELTLKLSLNLGSASNAKIYVAETDENGNVIRDEESFGYDIRLINSTAEFTKDRKEVQTVLMNSVYGTSTQDDWNQIFSEEGNDFGDYDAISGNGQASASTASPQTGDDTPVGWYLGLLSASFVLLAAGYRRWRLRGR